MRWTFWKKGPAPRPHIWDGWYCCIKCGAYWQPKYPESHFGPCPGWDPEAEDD